jgi:hypothetical protein
MARWRTLRVLWADGASYPFFRNCVTICFRAQELMLRRIERCRCRIYQGIRETSKRIIYWLKHAW